MKPLSQMTEEELKTLCKSLEERYGENSTVTIKQSDFNNMWASINRYIKENEKLKKHITELKVRLLDSREARGNATKVANTYLDQFADLSKKVEELEKQLKEANKIIRDYDTLREGYAYNPGDIYLKKWSLK